MKSSLMNSKKMGEVFPAKDSILYILHLEFVSDVSKQLLNCTLNRERCLNAELDRRQKNASQAM